MGNCLGLGKLDAKRVHQAREMFMQRECAVWTTGENTKSLHLEQKAFQSSVNFTAMNHKLCISCKKGKKGKTRKGFNQDNVSYVMFREDDNLQKWEIFTVCDGHGTQGEYVSKFCVEFLPYYFLISKHYPDRPEEALEESFHKTHTLLESLASEEGCDLNVSGSTVCMAVITNNTLYSANVGDSKMCVFDERGNTLYYTKLHTPEKTNEKERIAGCAGKILRLKLEDGTKVYRVIIEQKMKTCSLAMSRSMGDLVFKQYGVIYEPEIEKFVIPEKEKVNLVLGSDGLWDMLNSEEVCLYLSSGGTVEGLANVTKEKWVENAHPYCDDMTIFMKSSL